MIYYLNGDEIPSWKGEELFIEGGMNRGHDEMELKDIWAGRSDSEEMRDLIFELSGYELELIID
jgi:hypothetical protein